MDGTTAEAENHKAIAATSHAANIASDLILPSRLVLIYLSLSRIYLLGIPYRNEVLEFEQQISTDGANA
jgi:hypothetical protein